MKTHQTHGMLDNVDLSSIDLSGAATAKPGDLFSRVFPLGPNNVPVKFAAQWEAFEKGWTFMCTVTVMPAYRGETIKYYNGGGLKDLQDVLAYLDEPEWPSEILPEPQVGMVDSRKLAEIADAITAFRNESCPTVSAQDVYFGV